MIEEWAMIRVLESIRDGRTDSSQLRADLAHKPRVNDPGRSFDDGEIATLLEGMETRGLVSGRWRRRNTFRGKALHIVRLGLTEDGGQKLRTAGIDPWAPDSGA